MFSKKKLILNTLLSPRAKNSFEIGSGYTVDTGPRAKIIWKKPWINIYGHSLESNLSCSLSEQLIGLTYKIPFIHNPLEQYYLLQGGLVHEDIHNIRSSVITVNMARYWNCSNNWQRAINMHWNFNYCIQENIVKKSTMLIYPGISVSRIRKRGGITPFWGDSQRYSINISNTFWKSNINFIAFQAQNIWIRTLLEKHRILIRGNFSWIESNQFSSIASSLRFFSNRDCGIRGYKHQFISLYDHSIDVITSKLVTGTFEYQYNLIDKWWCAVFIDAGEIANKIKWDNFKSGMGFGIRWQLPVGPMKLDIAIPLTNKRKIDHKFLYFYINLGPEL